MEERRRGVCSVEGCEDVIIGNEAGETSPPSHEEGTVWTNIL